MPAFPLTETLVSCDMLNYGTAI